MEFIVETMRSLESVAGRQPQKLTSYTSAVFYGYACTSDEEANELRQRINVELDGVRQTTTVVDNEKVLSNLEERVANITNPQG
jgi:hypothetical protein